MFLSRSWRWQLTLDCEIPSSSDTLKVLVIGFTSMAWCTASESLDLDIPNVAWSSKFLQPEQNFLNNLVTVLWLTAPLPSAERLWLYPRRRYGPIRIHKAEVPDLNFVASSSVQLSNQTRSETMYNVSAH